MTSGRSGVIIIRLWRLQQNVNRTGGTRGRCIWRSSFLLTFMDWLCRMRNKIMYVLWRRTVYALTRVSFCWLFPSLLWNSENKYQNNPPVSAETIRLTNTCFILHWCFTWVHETGNVPPQSKTKACASFIGCLDSGHSTLIHFDE